MYSLNDWVQTRLPAYYSISFSRGCPAPLESSPEGGLRHQYSGDATVATSPPPSTAPAQVAVLRSQDRGHAAAQAEPSTAQLAAAHANYLEFHIEYLPTNPPPCIELTCCFLSNSSSSNSWNLTLMQIPWLVPILFLILLQHACMGTTLPLSSSPAQSHASM